MSDAFVLFYEVVHLLSLLLASVFGYWAVFRTEMRAKRWFGLLMLGVALWAVFVATNLFVADRSVLVALTVLSIVVGLMVPLLWVVFAAEYTYRSIRGNIVIYAFGGAYIVLAAAALTTPLHGYYAAFDLHRAPFVHVEMVSGPIRMFGFAYTLSGMAVGAYYLARLFERGSSNVSRPTGILAGAVLLGIVPFAASLLEVVPIPTYDHTPLAISVFVLGVGYIVVRYNFYNLSPIGREMVFDEITDAILVIDTELRLVDSNGAASEVFSEVTDESTRVPLKTIDPELTKLVKHADSNGDQEQEMTRRVDGKPRHFLVTVSTIERGSKPIGSVLVLRDVTERNAQQEQLEAERNRIRAITNAIPDVTIVYDREGQYREVLTAQENLLVDDPEKLTGTNLSEGVDPEAAETILGGIEAALDTGTVQTVEYSLELEGEQTWFEGRIAPKPGGYAEEVVVLARDITERRRNEEALDQARAELRKVIDLVPDRIFARNREGGYLLANEATAQQYGLSPEEVENRDLYELERDLAMAEKFRAEDRQVIESGEPVTIAEDEVVTNDGEKRIFQTTKIPFEPPGRDERAVLGYAREITELKEYEAELESQRDNLEVLNMVVRHDIRNNLQLVLAYAETLEDHVQTGGEEYIQQVLEAAGDAVDITETARDVTEILLQQQTECEPVELQGILQNEIEDVRSSNSQAIVRVTDPIPEIEVLADDMLASVFRNLLSNAISHNDKDVPEVTVTPSTAEDVVRIRIADNGPGISEEQKERIFEEGEKGIDSGGTGLGLYLVQTLVDRYGGQVWVEDNEPEGSVFVVELPVVT